MIKFFGSIVIMYPIHLILFRVMKWDHVTLYTFVTKYTFQCQCDKWQTIGCRWVSLCLPNSFCTYTHTHIHMSTSAHTHTHTPQCPDIPGLWKETCSYRNKIKSDTTWKLATGVYSSNGCSAENTYSNPKPHISMSVWKMTNYRIPMISLSPKFFLCAHTHIHTRVCTHTPVSR